MHQREDESHDNAGTANPAIGEPEAQDEGYPEIAREGRGGGLPLDAADTAVLQADVEEIGHELNEFIALTTSGWSGPLPSPDVLSLYPDEIQDKIVAWSDTQIMGAARRADYIAETERIAIEGDKASKTRSQWMSFGINIAFLAAAFLSFVFTNGNVASFGFLAVPGITIAVNVVNSVRRGGKD